MPLRSRPFPLHEQAENMTPEYIDLRGHAIDAEALDIPRARQIASAITGGRLDFVHLLECRKIADPSAEILVIEVEVERPQVVVNPIQRIERLAIVLSVDDETYPEVLAVRKGFPIVPHLNITFDEDTRSLCLYDQSWDEVKARWTAPTFIERIRMWLADTAIGSLHREDQPLEQVLMGSGYQLVLPWSAMQSRGEAAVRLDFGLIPSGEFGGTFVAWRADDGADRTKKPQFIASLFFAGKRRHGVIRRAPRTLEELCDFVRSEDFDLLTELRNRVMSWKDDGCLDAALIFVLGFPLQRDDSSDVEVTDTWAFVTMKTVYEVGEAIGVWERTGGKVGAFIAPIPSLRGAAVPLDIVRPHFSFTRDKAAAASGETAVKAKTVAVGVGAIGSQTVMHLVRSGFGCWTIIDDDELLPHNLARHALLPNAVGCSKAGAMGATINMFFEDEEPSTAIRENVLHPKDASEKVSNAIAESELVLDFSASVPVARHLAADARGGRRASVFLNPRGSDLVVLCEDALRSTRLDALEAQYYRAVIRNSVLQEHLKANENRRRYSRSCRDVSFTLPTHLVGLHSAIAAQAVRSCQSSMEAAIRVWRADPVECAVVPVNVPILPHFRVQIGGWTVVLDQGLLDHLQQLRSERLPNETGGVLVGMYDLPRKIVYVVDTIPSPADSRETPVSYIRGCEGLAERVTEIAEETAGEVQYVGEWHSHPDGYGCEPSQDDVNLFANITDRMTAAGYPAFMAIIGPKNQSAWFLGMMASDCSWNPPGTI